MNTKLSHLPLRPSTLSILTRRGFNSTTDVQASRSSGLSIFAAELEISLIEAAGIGREIDQAMRYISGGDGGGSQETDIQNTGTSKKTEIGGETAASILSAHYHQQKSNSSSSSKYQYISRPIITFAKSIDTLTGGGIQPREVTEIAGSPGTGKTQLAMQLCVDVTLPKAFGGVDGSSVYIDSEGSFSPERCHDMAHALVQHVHNSVRRKQRSASVGGSHNAACVPESFTTEQILDSINVFRVYDETSQTATITSIPHFLDAMEQDIQKKPVKLLVVDSIAFHYRCSSSDYKSRTKSLTNIAALLSDIANKYNLAVVVINQMTTRGGNMGGDSSFNVNSNNVGGGDDNSSDWKLIPALGESWAHATTTRLLLMNDEHRYGQNHQRRICKLCKSPHKPSGRALFSITQFGIRDCVLPTSN